MVIGSIETFISSNPPPTFRFTGASEAQGYSCKQLTRVRVKIVVELAVEGANLLTVDVHFVFRCYSSSSFLRVFRAMSWVIIGVPLFGFARIPCSTITHTGLPLALL
jgi:hypothetical protein